MNRYERFDGVEYESEDPTAARSQRTSVRFTCMCTKTLVAMSLMALVLCGVAVTVLVCTWKGYLLPPVPNYVIGGVIAVVGILEAIGIAYMYIRHRRHTNAFL